MDDAFAQARRRGDAIRELERWDCRAAFKMTAER
jgi:hypothetical protein